MRLLHVHDLLLLLLLWVLLLRHGEKPITWERAKTQAKKNCMQIVCSACIELRTRGARHKCVRVCGGVGAKVAARRMCATRLSSMNVLPLSGALSRKIAITRGDITKLHVDAIVNAANNSLLGGGGVDGAIHRAAADARFLAECREHNGCATGWAKTTGSYNLPTKAVIHTVGPVYARQSPSNSRALLQAAYRNSLHEAVRHRCRTVAFPSLSTGAYGYPVADASAAALEQVAAFLLGPHGADIDQVIFCTFSPEDLATYEASAKKVFSL